MPNIGSYIPASKPSNCSRVDSGADIEKTEMEGRRSENSGLIRKGGRGENSSSNKIAARATLDT